jgi:hypothetical protein
MKRFLNRFSHRFGTKAALANLLRSFRSQLEPPSRNSRRQCPYIETLEDRLVPSIDMTQLAQMFTYPTSTPANLHLNFDGAGAYESDYGAPFGRTYQDIQDILFRVSEIYAPFNVEVSRIYGTGNLSAWQGSRTIFVSGSTPAGGMTPPGDVDYPCANTFYTHQPYSDAWANAFVNDSGSNFGDASAIAHEAGHTFGLAHVLSSPTLDVMSYDTGGTASSLRYYADKSFSITDKNGNGTDPNFLPGYSSWNLFTPDFWIDTQNSFTYLETVLGDRPKDSNYHVVHTGSVDPVDWVSQYPWTPNYTFGQTVYGSLNRSGDFDVYKMVAPSGQLFFPVHLDLTPTYINGPNTPPWLRFALVPDLLVYDASGNLVQFVNNTYNPQTGDWEVHSDLKVQSGKTFYLVVGTPDGNLTTLGGYKLQTSYDTSVIILGGSSPAPGQATTSGSGNLAVIGGSDNPVDMLPITPLASSTPRQGETMQQASVRLAPVNRIAPTDELFAILGSNESNPGQETAGSFLTLVAGG